MPKASEPCHLHLQGRRQHTPKPHQVGGDLGLGGFSLCWQCQDCPGGSGRSQGGVVALGELVMRICSRTMSSTSGKLSREEGSASPLGKNLFPSSSASSRQHRGKIRVVFSPLSPSYQPQEPPLGDPQGFLWDTPRDASKTSPRMPPGSLWLAVPAGRSWKCCSGKGCWLLGEAAQITPRFCTPGLPAGCCWSLCLWLFLWCSGL